MIYLFDDDKYGQMSQNYQLNFVQELPLHKTTITHMKAHNYSSIPELLKNAAVILMHDSFPDFDKTQNIKAECTRQQIPLVIFSNQYTGNITRKQGKTTILKLNKDQLYKNMMPFVEHYKTTNQVNLDLLLYGSNYLEEKTRIIQNRLNMHLFRRQNQFNYTRDFDLHTQPYNDLHELFSMSKSKDDFEAWEADLIDKSAGEIKKIIAQLVLQILDTDA